MKVILLAAGTGRRFGKRTRTLPKCLIPIGKNKGTLLSRYLRSLDELGLKKTVLVVGHHAEKIKKACREIDPFLAIKFIFNKDYKKGSIVSLYTARGELDEDCLIMDADVFFPTAALKRLLTSKNKSSFLCDTHVKSSGEEMLLFSKNGSLWAISKRVDPSLKIVGESVGFLKIDRKNAFQLKKLLESFVRQEKRGVEYEEVYNLLMKKTEIGFETMNGFFWTEMDFEEDWKKILSHLKP